MTGVLSSNALPPLDPFSCDDDEDTYRLPQLRRLGVDAAAPELRALLGEDALDEDVTRPNRPGPERTVVLVEGVDGFMVGHSDVLRSGSDPSDLYEPTDEEIIAEGDAVNLEEVPSLPSAADVEDTRAGSVFGALAAQAVLPEIPALPSARVTHA